MKKRWQRRELSGGPYTGSVEEAQPTTRRVLVVEDDESIRNLVALHLRLEKLDVMEVGRRSAGAAARAGRFST